MSAAFGTITLDDGSVVDSLPGLQARAVGRWDEGLRAFIEEGAGDNAGVRANRIAHRRWGLEGRVLVDVSKLDTTTTVLGQPVSMPVLLAPSGLHTLVHPDGEVATATGARDAGTVMILSSGCGRPVEDVAGTGVQLWFQLYWGEDRDRVRHVIQTAERAGARALVLTVDQQVRPLLGAAMRAGVASVAHARPMYLLPRSIHLSGDAWDHDPRLTWNDLAWLREATSLPIVLKGIMSPADVAPARAAGVDAIVVSNHGGRVTDTPIGTMDVLAEIAAELRSGGPGAPELYIDGGFRHGAEIVAALALGARAVLVGRPALWSLATGGAPTVTAMLRLLRYQLAACMARVGATAVGQLSPEAVRAIHPGAGGLLREG